MVLPFGGWKEERKEKGFVACGSRVSLSSEETRTIKKLSSVGFLIFIVEKRECKESMAVYNQSSRLIGSIQ